MNHFFIMVDLIIFLNKEVIHICVQFVHHDIREDILQYAKLTNVTG